VPLSFNSKIKQSAKKKKERYLPNVLQIPGSSVQKKISPKKVEVPSKTQVFVNSTIQMFFHTTFLP